VGQNGPSGSEGHRRRRRLKGICRFAEAGNERNERERCMLERKNNYQGRLTSMEDVIGTDAASILGETAARRRRKMASINQALLTSTGCLVFLFARCRTVLRCSLPVVFRTFFLRDLQLFMICSLL
jgi:hypothetical protein